MYQLEFTTAHSYGSDRGISVPVLLKSGPNSVRIAASIDTGATFCVFRNELAEALGLDLANATPKRFHTATGSFEAFGHDVEISVLGITTFSTVYFFADASINKNVLGRIGWLDRVQLALVDHDSTLYVAPYGNA
ncbi:MAG: retropepsin-like aspartic protease [Bryobacteraceae bacterium]|jgi:predicted aspartyl protease